MTPFRVEKIFCPLKAGKKWSLRDGSHENSRIPVATVRQEFYCQRAGVSFCFHLQSLTRFRIQILEIQMPFTDDRGMVPLLF